MGQADEHFIPGTSRITEIESFHRYYVAAELCRNCRVLDAASGDGYGSAILASRNGVVTGIDLNQQAVTEASQKYLAENLNFVHGDVAAMPFEDNTFDRVVSFETIEHIPDQTKFLQEIRRVLKPEGILILSSPNRTPFRTRNKGENSYHINELENDELKKLLENYFPRMRFYSQDAFYNSVITGDGEFVYYVRNKNNRIIRQKALTQVQYSIVIASENELPEFTPSCYLDAFYDPKRGYVLDDEAVVNQFGLRGEFEKAYKELAELQQELRSLAEAKSCSEAQNRSLEGSLESLRETNSKLQSENNSQAARNEELAGIVGNVSKAVDSVQQLNNNLVEELRIKSGENAELRKLVESLRQESWKQAENFSVAKVESKEQQRVMELLRQENQALAEKCQLKADENGEILRNMETLRQEKEFFSEECTARNTEIEELHKNIEGLHEEKKHLTEECTARGAEIEELHKNVEELRVEKELLTEECTARGAEIDELHKNIEELHEEKELLTEECTARGAEIDELHKNVEELHEEKELLTEECTVRNTEIDRLNKNIEELRVEKEHLTEECTSRSAEIDRLNENVGSLLREKELLSEKSSAQSVEIKQLWESIETAEEKNRVLSEECRMKNGENTELRSKVKSLEELCRQLRKECDVANAKNAENNRKIQIMQETNQKLAEQNAGQEARSSALEQNVAEMRSEIGKNRELIQQLSGQLEQLKQQLDEANRVIGSKDAEKQEFINQIEALKLDWASAYEQVTAQGKELEQVNAQLKERESDVNTLKLQWTEEHAKAEYLYHEYLDMKDSLSFRLLGRFHLRKKARNALCRTAEQVHKVGHGMLEALPGSYSNKMAVRNKLYTRFGGLLQNVESYQEWHQHYAGLQALHMKGETGLIMPKDVPMTSIIIPVYNNIELTKRCLHSIYNIGTRSPFEVIIVDDCSTDDYASLTKDFPEVRVIRNEKNSGFLLTVNRGAKEAKGEYILILNNDTEVVPGWLDELTTALYKHPEAGMIGSQLIHLRTGTLQESGNLICKNGDMMPLGRGEDPNHPQFTYFREVDFCSAASIILRKKVFVDEMDGFDRIYVPAYFEDPDLGLRLKKAGYKNYVCPLSRVLHQEMASYGDALDDKCAKNRGVFMGRWGKYLEENALYRDRNEPNECMKFPRPRIMYIDAETPMADRGSGGMDAIFFMEYMIKRGYDVVFHGEYTPGYTPKYTTILLRMGVECVYEPQRKIWEYLAAAGWTFSYIFVSRIYQARCFDRLLKKYCPQAAYIFDTVDVHFVREQLEADLKDDDDLRKLAADTKRYELAISEAADATIVISSDEKKLLENDYKLTNVYHIPQARELFGLAPNPNRRGAVFIGSAHPPNMDGLRYFHDEILPLLPRDFKLTIIGEALRMMIGKSDEYKDLLKCPQYNFVGFVEDLGTELNNAKITIAPLRYGAGTKGKVASSMSYGVPCVSSRFGTEGTGMVHGDNIMIAKTPQEFADYIMQLMNDEKLWKKISDGGIKFIKDNYAPETVEKMMDKLFADVDKRHAENHSYWATTPVVPKVDEV